MDTTTEGCRENRSTAEPDLARSALRQRAETRLGERGGLPDTSLSPEEAQCLVHDLRVHEMELELQNEELRRAQEALEISHARYFDLYDLAPVGYLTLAEHGLIRDVNLAAARLLGMPRSLLINIPLSLFIQPNDYDRLYHCRQDLIVTGERQSCEVLLRRQDGRNISIQLEMTLGVDRQTGAMQCLTLLTDVSERKCAEAMRQEENRRRERFIASLGHELRNPLAPIRHIAEILNFDACPDPARIKQAAQILGRQIGHLTRLIDDLLDVTRIGRGGIPLAKRQCDLREVVQMASEQLCPLIEQSRQEMDLRLPEAPANVYGDPVRLAQVVANLVRNASRFSPPGARIILELATDEDSVQLRVQDQGIGLDAAALSRIFAAFEQAEHTTDSIYGGLGMGLPLAKRLVELHGGRIEADSPGPDQGSTFSVHLPLSRQAPLDVMPARRGATLGRLRILVVEDNQDVADACVLLLQMLDQEATAVADGPTALATAERLHPDLILIDLGLPVMDGFEVAHRLRATDAGRRTRLVAITGFGQDRERSRKAGFDDHLLKPVGRAALAAVLADCPSSA